MANENNEAPEEAQPNETRPDGLTLQERRALGSAEWNAMTFTPPGGEAMTLDEYARHQLAEKKRGSNEATGENS